MQPRNLSRLCIINAKHERIYRKNHADETP